MTWDPGIGTESCNRDLSRYFRRWRTKARMLSVMNWIQPVSVVDHWRDDEEGSHFGIYFETGSAAGQHPAMFFGSLYDTVDVEILGIQAWYKWVTNPGAISWNMMCHLFTPIAPYNPVQTIDPVGVGRPGLITNSGFDRGNCYVFGGYAAAMPAYVGWTGYVLGRAGRTFGSVGFWYPIGVDGLLTAIPLEQPLRLLGTDGIALQMENPSGSARLALAATIYYRERGIG